MSDKNKLLVVVATHGGYPKAQEYHLPLWQSHGGDVLTYFPEESTSAGVPASFEASPSTAFGKSAKTEPLSAERFKWLLATLFTETDKNVTHFLLYNQGAICLQPNLPDKFYSEDVLWGAFPSVGDDQIATKPIPHFPLFFSRNILKQMLEALKNTKETLDAKVWNNVVLWLVTKGGIPKAALGKLSFARDIINPKDEIAAINAIRDGAIFLTGVQSGGLNNRSVRQFRSAYEAAQQGHDPVNPRIPRGSPGVPMRPSTRAPGSPAVTATPMQAFRSKATQAIRAQQQAPQALNVGA